MLNTGFIRFVSVQLHNLRLQVSTIDGLQFVGVLLRRVIDLRCCRCRLLHAPLNIHLVGARLLVLHRRIFVLAFGSSVMAASSVVMLVALGACR